MSDFDDTNRGVAFTPFDTQQMNLQGKNNDNGNESRVVFVKDQTRSGKTVIGVYERVGTLFQNDKGENEKAPDYTGDFGMARRLAAWRRSKDGKPYMSLSVSDKTQNVEASPVNSVADDSIPF